MERLTVKYCGGYVPKEMCSIDRFDGADDCDLCCEYCRATEEEGVDCDCLRNFIKEEFGKTVFLTKEEAEAALEGMA